MDRFKIIPLLLTLFLFSCTDGEKERNKNEEDPLLRKDSSGQELVRYPNGNKKMTGRYRDGKRHGVWTSWYKDGSKKSELRFQHGKRHGFYQTWYKNGNLRYNGAYHHGERTGTWKYFDQKGELIKTQKFDHTERDK